MEFEEEKVLTVRLTRFQAAQILADDQALTAFRSGLRGWLKPDAGETKLLPAPETKRETIEAMGPTTRKAMAELRGSGRMMHCRICGAVKKASGMKLHMTLKHRGEGEPAGDGDGHEPLPRRHFPDAA